MITLQNGFRLGLILGASTSALMSTGVLAQDQADETVFTIEEVIVTAQKRAQSVQDVPASIVAFDANFQKRANLDDVKDLIKFSPGLAGNSNDSFIDRINIRGISTNDFGVGGDPSVAFFKNGFYQGRNGVAVTSLFDLDRAEVLRGPQGFLFGRNSIAGALSLHTARPNFDGPSGYIDAGLGERDIYELEAAYNLPVSDRAAFRLAGYYSHEDGYVSNEFFPDADKLIAHEKYALRGTGTVKGDNWDATLSVEYEDRKQSGTVYRGIEDDEIFPVLQDTLGLGPFSDNVRTANSDLGLGNFDNGEIFAVTSEINIDFDFATLTSLTQYRDHVYDYAEDFDGTPLTINSYGQDQSGNYFEQELRLVGQNDGPLSWYAGVSGYQEDIDVLFTQQIGEEVICQYYYASTCADYFTDNDFGLFEPTAGGLRERNRVIGDYWGWGAYLDLTYQISEKLEFSAGLRYSYDKKNFSQNILPVDSLIGPFFFFGFTTDGAIRRSESWDDFAPRFTLTYHPSDDVTLYGSVTKGYKSGGFGSFGIDLGPDEVDDDLVALPGALPNAFNPESVWSYEAGIKGNFLNGRIRYDLSTYYYRYKDLQLSFFEVGGTRVSNIGRVRGKGAEATVQAVLNQYFDLYTAVTVQDSSIRGADEVCEDCDGNRLVLQPKLIVAGALNGHYPVTNSGELTGTIDFHAQTSGFGGLDNLAVTRTGGWGEVALRVGYRDEDAGWSVIAYVENLFEENYFENALDGDGIIPHLRLDPSRPRTFGIKFSKRFGE